MGVTKRVLIALSLAAALSCLGAVAAEPEANPRNVKLTVRLGKLVDGKRGETKSYDLALVSGGVPSRLLSGARVPLPTSGGGEGEAGGAIVYQNIGFSTEAFAWVLADGRIKITATIEDSRLAVHAPQPPTVETRQLSVSAILKPGVPQEVTRVNGIGDLSGFVEVEAQVAP